MRTIRIRYHREPDGWWADSPDLDGYVAAGESLTEVRDLAKDGIPFFTEDDDVEIEEYGPGYWLPIVSMHLDYGQLDPDFRESSTSAYGFAEPATLTPGVNYETVGS